MASYIDQRVDSTIQQRAGDAPLPDLRWYQIDASAISSDARNLLEKWSGIPPEMVSEHVNEIRTKAFKIYPYPCIAMYRFLDLSIMNTAQYPEILSRLKKGEKLLDFGCCFGQEIRQLAFDGAPSVNLYGTDLRQEYLDLGYDLFQDRSKLKSTFFAADAFKPNEALTSLEGQLSIIYTGSFFHLFDFDGQFEIAKLVVRLLKPEPGSMLLGRQVGNVHPGEYTRPGYRGEHKRFRHDDRTWREMWERVGQETGSRWEVEARMDTWGFGRGKFGSGERKLQEERREEGTRRLIFVVRRV